ncbi:MAG: tetratricopeptide repeat protein [Phycisphaera sp.]|nr:tetratricopeptide repeat protein [Phycisphaera sp.]
MSHAKQSWWIAAAVVIGGLALAVVPSCSRDAGESGDGAKGAGDVAAPVVPVTPVASKPAAPAGPVGQFVGRNACVACHVKEAELWTGSYHDRAMQEPTDDTVLGDFNDATFENFGVVSKFFKKDGRFVVHTEGPEGRMQDYDVKYVFGVYPLQQYLIEFPGGRLQCLTIAWDSRPKEQGGQRWYHLYPASRITADNWLHWTQRGQNWNSMCSDCHSTNLKLGYDAPADTYHTTWSELDVSCEACHGPGSKHVEWAAAYKLDAADADAKWSNRGLAVDITTVPHAFVNDEKGLHVTSEKPFDDMQVDTCARCHARRGHVSVQYRHGDPLLDHYMPALLEENLYFADGQIQDEDYVYGSFTQSKMYHNGVRCSDCHNPHTTKIIAQGNALCVRCHLPQKYDTTEHHHHQAGSTGSLCVECHMPTRTYMVVDPRRDHSLRIPRPDLSVELGTPNACNNCHTHAEKDAKWAAEAVMKWYGDKWPKDERAYARIFTAARRGMPEAGPYLVRQTLDVESPGIVRATAAVQLQQYLTQDALGAAIKAIRDDDPLVRSNAVMLFQSVGPEQRVQYVAPLLGDPVRAVRHRAARVLIDVPKQMFTAQQAAALDEALAGYEEALLAHSGNRDAQMELGGYYADRHDWPKAIAAFRKAIEWDGRHIDAYMALATLYSQIGRNQDAEPLIRKVIEMPRGYGTSAEVWNRVQAHANFSLGLLLVEAKRYEEAVGHLAKATELAPDRGRYFYNLGLLYNQLKRPDDTEAALLKAHQLEPRNGEYLFALATTCRDAGHFDKALKYAQQLADIYPNDPGPQQLMQELMKQQLLNGAKR